MMQRIHSPDKDEDENSALVVIRSYQYPRQAHEAGLAILASGHSYWVYSSEEGYALAVPREHAQQLRREVEIAEIKNRYWPPPSPDLPDKKISKVPTAVAVILLIATFAAQNEFPFLKELGMNSSMGVAQNGEWWRIITAITLHSDISHLSGNLLSISVFGYLCCRYMGSGLAWLLILLAASTANFTNVLLRIDEAFFSLGASTAAFAALGLLTGFPIGTYLRSQEPMTTRDWLIPFFGGCVLFAWLGGGDFPTDVAGHLWSFIYGLALSIIVSWISLYTKISKQLQGGLLGLNSIIIIGAWGLALTY